MPIPVLQDSRAHSTCWNVPGVTESVANPTPSWVHALQHARLPLVTGFSRAAAWQNIRTLLQFYAAEESTESVFLQSSVQAR